MPRIIPIRDLKKTGEIAQLCQNASEPIFVTKNGYGEMVIMSMKMYEERMLLHDVYAKLDEAEADITAQNVADSRDSLRQLRRKYGL